MAAQSTEALPSGAQKTEGHIFFSNPSIHNKDADKIRDYLTKNGHRCWMAKHDLAGKNAIGAAGVTLVRQAMDEASAIVVGYSFPYKLSIRCQQELTYAIAKNKHIIPIKLQKNYKADGKLGLKLAAYKGLDMSQSDQFDKNAKVLLEMVKSRPKEETYANLHYSNM